MYLLNVVGLACFSKREEGGGRMVLMPDGRENDRPIDPHIPRIVVRTQAISAIDPRLSSRVLESATVITLPKCTLEFEGADASPDETDLDTTRHDPFVQRLQDIDREFDGNNAAQAVVKTRIRRGELVAFRHPGSAEEDPAVISRLEVPHDETIRITVTPDDGSAAMEISLNPGTEIVLANTATRMNPLNTSNHFLIYEKLSERPVNFGVRPQSRVDNLRRLPSGSPFFRIAGGIGTHGDCGNTGCC